MTAPPIAEPLRSSAPVPLLDLDWAGAAAEIAGTETYLAATVSPDSRPHVVPVLGVWVDGELVFNTDASARKARHLARNPAIAVTAPGDDYDFTLEGFAEQITDASALHAVADAFPRKYEWWHPQVVDGRFVADDRGVVRVVYAVHAENVFGFGKKSGFSGVRWRFSRSS
jgi:nitroimidazol reductase NimA-like FMN-containing flavoprotein (pyridoxamine 5'-phosphate oxidase superfamily)